MGNCSNKRHETSSGVKNIKEHEDEKCLNFIDKENDCSNNSNNKDNMDNKNKNISDKSVNTICKRCKIQLTKLDDSVACNSYRDIINLGHVDINEDTSIFNPLGYSYNHILCFNCASDILSTPVIEIDNRQRYLAYPRAYFPRLDGRPNRYISTAEAPRFINDESKIYYFDFNDLMDCVKDYCTDKELAVAKTISVISSPLYRFSRDSCVSYVWGDLLSICQCSGYVESKKPILCDYTTLNAKYNNDGPLITRYDQEYDVFFNMISRGTKELNKINRREVRKFIGELPIVLENIVLDYVSIIRLFVEKYGNGFIDLCQAIK